MAILINKTINYKGISLNQIYIRLSINLNIGGKNISTKLYTYNKKESYTDNKLSNVLDFDDIPKKIDFNYDREVDGNDILTFVHNNVIKYLSTDIIKTEIFIDEETNEERTKEIIINKKICEPSQIFKIDL